MMATPIRIVAAKNAYGSVAKEIGGSTVEVTSIMSKPDQETHLLNVSLSIVKNLEADFIVFSGLGYDA